MTTNHGGAMDSGEQDPSGIAAQVLHRLRGRGETLATAESLTGGLVAAAFVDIPGASMVFRGGLVPYATSLKATLVGVDEELLAQYGPVSRQVAEGLAEGAREKCGADWGVSTTGVAGPDRQDDQPVGTVFIGVARSGGARTKVNDTYGFQFAGDRGEIRRQAVTTALRVLVTAINAYSSPGE